MNNKKIFIVLFLLLFFTNVSAQGSCSSVGYTVAAINGVFTNEQEAILNKERLKQILPQVYNSESINVDYFYNPTHIAGVGDLVDVINQGFFNSKTDFDLVEMLNDASSKIKTQKLLLVGHSQGNFYANNFYDKVADKDGGVPNQSIGVYGVATPADRVAGNGEYITSDTDKVISTLMGSIKNIMKPNDHIELQDKNNNGHSFSDVYLKYSGNKIISDIKYSLNKLSSNKIQGTQDLCISPQKISISHSIVKAVVSAADFVVNTIVGVGNFISTNVVNTAKSLTSLLGNGSNKNLAQVGSFDNQESQITQQQEEVSSLENNPIEVVDSTDSTQIGSLNKDVENEAVVSSAEDVNEVLDSTIPDNQDNTNNNTSNIINTNSGGGGPSPVTVVDTTAPVITINGEDPKTIEINSVYNDSGASAIDAIDGGVLVTTLGSVDTSIVGVYTLTYTAKDNSNNISTKTRIVNVVENTTPITPVLDTNAPVITLYGKDNINILLGSIYTDLGAIAQDEVDGTVDIITSGNVNTSVAGTYTLTYTAKDKTGNIATKDRTVNIINTVPVASTTTSISLPNSGIYTGDGLDQNKGRKNLTPFVFQIIYTDSNNNPPKDIKLHIKNTKTGVLLPEVLMNKIVQGSDILSDGNYTNGEIYTISNTYDEGEYSYSFSADDKNGNYALINESDLLRFSVIPSSYVYVAKPTFGLIDENGHDWQDWAFDGANIYNWNDTYVNNYLREQFKIQTYPYHGFGAQTLQRGLFNHDPRKGFEINDLIISSLENNPQNNVNYISEGLIYDVVIQWDNTGYTYTISHDEIIDSTGHTDIVNMNNNIWIGWDSLNNKFTYFPTGTWHGVPLNSPMQRTGGSDFMLTPYPIYSTESNSVPIVEPDPTPTPDPVIPTLSSEKLITIFNFSGLIPSSVGSIDNVNKMINLRVQYGTDIKSILPSVEISNKSSIIPAADLAQDFTKPVTYTVTAEDGSTSVYTVIVIILPDINNMPPVISSYSLNGIQDNITLNPLANNLSIILNANKNVNWMSIKIENENDPSLYRMFQSGDGCVDGTNTCSKNWDGILSKGGLLQNGNYKIKVHMQDSMKNDYDTYLPSVITVNIQ